MLKLNGKKTLVIIFFFIFHLFLSCSRYVAIQNNTLTESKFPKSQSQENVNIYQRFNNGQIALLYVEEKECIYTRLALDGTTIYSPDTAKKRQWIISLIPGEHHINFDIDVHIDKKGRYYSSQKNINTSFRAEGGSIYTLQSKRKGYFHWEPIIIKTLSYNL